MRILFVAGRDLASPLAGGSEVLIDRLACGLVERGYDVALLCGGPTAPRRYDVCASGGWYSQFLHTPLKYLRHFRDYDLVVDVANGMAFFAPLWRRKPVLCLVNHVHTAQWDQWFPAPVAALGRFLESRAMPLAYRKNLFVTVSRSTAADLEAIGIAGERIRIVHNGTDLMDPTHPKSPEPLFLSLGRLVPHKRLDALLEAWERVRPRVGGRLVIAGSGPDASRLQALAGDGVEFAGQVSDEDKLRLLSEAWVLLHPSMLEGWGLVVMEAAVTRTPAIGFDAPGVRESIIHGETGLLATCPDTFVEHWVSLAENEARRTEMGRLARQRAARFSWSSTVERFIPVAEEALARHRAPLSARSGRQPDGRSETPWISP